MAASAYETIAESDHLYHRNSFFLVFTADDYLSGGELDRWSIWRINNCTQGKLRGASGQPGQQLYSDHCGSSLEVTSTLVTAFIKDSRHLRTKLTIVTCTGAC